MGFPAYGDHHPDNCGEPAAVTEPKSLAVCKKMAGNAMHVAVAGTMWSLILSELEFV
jgi:hypothetical protein